MSNEIRCDNCGWVGKHDELVKNLLTVHIPRPFVDTKRCPECNGDTFHGLDGVGRDDYLQQQSGDREVIE